MWAIKTQLTLYCKSERELCASTYLILRRYNMIKGEKIIASLSPLDKIIAINLDGFHFSISQIRNKNVYINF